MTLLEIEDLGKPPPMTRERRTFRKRSEPSSFGQDLGVSLFTEGACINIMELALRMLVEIDCILETEAIRERFHDARVTCRRRVDHRFDGLTFQDDNFFLLIYTPRPGEPRLCGGMWAVRSGARFCFDEERIIRQR